MYFGGQNILPQTQVLELKFPNPLFDTSLAEHWLSEDTIHWASGFLTFVPKLECPPWLKFLPIWSVPAAVTDKIESVPNRSTCVFIYFFWWPGTGCSDVYYFRFPHDSWFYEPHSRKWDACSMFLKSWLPGCERLAVFSLSPCITWVLCFNESGLQGKGTPIYSLWPVNWCCTWFENRQSCRENNRLKKTNSQFQSNIRGNNNRSTLWQEMERDTKRDGWIIDGIQGGRANKDNCVVRELKPHMILEFNAITSGSEDLLLKDWKQS